jgi:hypothetical protein
MSDASRVVVSMSRVLVAVRDARDLQTLRRGVAAAATRGAELAVCQVTDDDHHASDLHHQQAMTKTLRGLLGDEAESVAVFVVSGRAGDDVASCAAAWGADEIVRWDGKTEGPISAD